MQKKVIAIDGPAASGKSTVASGLAARLGIPYVNTGNMYRAVTLALMEAGLSAASSPEELERALSRIELTYAAGANGKFQLLLNGRERGEELRSPEVAAQVSPVAALPCVRAFLKEKQRQCAESGLIVMEGRDIGTAIFPDAQWKFFITASPEVRARRRLAQTGENFSGATLQEVAAAIAERDRIDSTRATAPLRQAADARKIDTSDLSIEEVLDQIIAVVQS